MRHLDAAALLVLLAAASATGCTTDSSTNGGAGGGRAGQPSAAGATSGGGGCIGAGGVAANGGHADGGKAGSVSAPDEDAPSREVTFAPSDALILNPERGFYATASLVDAPDLSGLRASGVTLVHSYVRLDDYRTSDLPESLLAQVAAGFEQARLAGVKVVLRFAYNFGPYPDSEPDAPQSWVLTHIEQLASRCCKKMPT